MMQFAEDVKAYSRNAAEFDAPIRCELLYGDAREAVSKITGKYRCALSFPRQYDVHRGLNRFDPVIDALQYYAPDGTRDPVHAVLDLTTELQAAYHRDALSAASKILWFLWGRDILVYDKRTLVALQQRYPKLPPRDYREYCYAWIALFTEYADAIAETCAKLGAPNERSFHERVFDWHLWRSRK